ncbi:MAG: HAD hydrolase family protein [Oscillospiraceae bacterium]
MTSTARLWTMPPKFCRTARAGLWKRCEKRGHLAVLNTGRPRSHIDPRLLTWTWDGCISGCGMEVQAGGRTLHRVLPEAAVCRRMRDLIRACRLDVLFEVSGGLILDGTRPQGPQVRLEADRMRAKGFSVTEDPDRPDFCFEKFVVFHPDGGDLARFQSEASRDFTLIDRGGGMTEAVLQGSSKSTGIRLLLQHFGLCPQDAVAFGDSTNDIPMFQCVSTPIAMGGCPEVVRRAAVYTTASVLEDGIWNGLRRFGLI